MKQSGKGNKTSGGGAFQVEGPRADKRNGRESHRSLSSAGFPMTPEKGVDGKGTPSGGRGGSRVLGVQETQGRGSASSGPSEVLRATLTKAQSAPATSGVKTKLWVDRKNVGVWDPKAEDAPALESLRQLAEGDNVSSTKVKKSLIAAGVELFEHLSRVDDLDASEIYHSDLLWDIRARTNFERIFEKEKPTWIQNLTNVVIRHSKAETSEDKDSNISLETLWENLHAMIIERFPRQVNAVIADVRDNLASYLEAESNSACPEVKETRDLSGVKETQGAETNSGVKKTTGVANDSGVKKTLTLTPKSKGCDDSASSSSSDSEEEVDRNKSSKKRAKVDGDDEEEEELTAMGAGYRAANFIDRSSHAKLLAMLEEHYKNEQYNLRVHKSGSKTDLDKEDWLTMANLYKLESLDTWLALIRNKLSSEYPKRGKWLPGLATVMESNVVKYLVHSEAGWTGEVNITNELLLEKVIAAREKLVSRSTGVHKDANFESILKQETSALANLRKDAAEYWTLGDEFGTVQTGLRNHEDKLTLPKILQMFFLLITPQARDYLLQEFKVEVEVTKASEEEDTIFKWANFFEEATHDFVHEFFAWTMKIAKQLDRCTESLNHGYTTSLLAKVKKPVFGPEVTGKINTFYRISKKQLREREEEKTGGKSGKRGGRKIRGLGSRLGPKPPLAPPKDTKQHSDKLCHNCDKRGHIAKDCRSPKRCDNCGGHGHYQNDCSANCKICGAVCRAKGGHAPNKCPKRPGKVEEEAKAGAAGKADKADAKSGKHIRQVGTKRKKQEDSSTEKRKKSKRKVDFTEDSSPDVSESEGEESS
jgi:hypothetical protein